ncbi:MAG TPA: hypothetical protein PKG56_01360 [Chitinophagaceae bacterium]|nr:hypothetical protein [Chitinophagaceae bacterium]MCC6633920.1 hypothetical protein [Chitinophagaceae bacterium]HMZ46152.1 hypothetical protein [Chitinophagaceae bacterium]HNF29923.1 hypothetical protein [Chitinophagaceae bacterium]HNJ58045.1 hypothetical protein [Chitinophagaceae bacterium]
MFRIKNIQKISVAVVLLLAVQVLYATNIFSGGIERKNEVSKYSLKNLSRYNNKTLTLSTAKYSYKLKSTLLNNNSTLNNSRSSILLSNGNTTFIYPYKSKVKVPKFKTPSPTKF